MQVNQFTTAHLDVMKLFYRPTVDLIGAMETQSEPSELELDDVVITNPHIEAILENEDWIEDASYVSLVASHTSLRLP